MPVSEHKLVLAANGVQRETWHLTGGPELLGPLGLRRGILMQLWDEMGE